MTRPTYSQWRTPSTAALGLQAQTVAERQLAAWAALVTLTNPDGTPLATSAPTFVSVPADPMIDAIGVVTHTNSSPGTQGSTNPYGYTASTAWPALLTDLGIRHVRDDETIDLATLKGGDASTAAALTHQVSCYQTLQSLGVGIGTIVQSPEALSNLVNTVIPALASPLDWVECMNEENTTYPTFPSSWTQIQPPAPWAPLGWGNSRGNWANATSYNKGDYVAGGLTFGGTWVCVIPHVSSAGNSPDSITVPDNGGGAGSTGGVWIPGTGYSGPWVPMWACHSVLLGLLMRQYKNSGQIPAKTLICSGGTIGGGTDGLVAQSTLTATAVIMLGTPYYGCDMFQVHNYAGAPAAVDSVQSNFGTTANMQTAYGRAVLGETGGQSDNDNGTSEASIFTGVMVNMVETYRLAQLYPPMLRTTVYTLIDYSDVPGVGGAWPSPIPLYAGPVGTPPTVWSAGASPLLNQVFIPTGSVGGVSGNGYYFQCTVAGTTGGSQPAQFTSPPAYGTTFSDNTVTWKVLGQWEQFGLAAIANVTLNGTASHDFRKKNGWQTLKNLIAAVSDPGIPSPSMSLAIVNTNAANIRTPLLTRRVNGTFDFVLSSNTGIAVSASIYPAAGAWTQVGYIDPAAGSTVTNVQSNVAAANPYTATIQPYPTILRITL